jgi:hypothetical protein
MMPVHNKDLRRLQGCARLSAISEPYKPQSIGVNEPGRLGNGAAAAVVLEYGAASLWWEGPDEGEAFERGLFHNTSL